MATDIDPPVKVLVEVPKGSRNKYEYNAEEDAMELDRRLFAAVNYPGDYGFIPGTEAEDGDEVDALICLTEHTFPGCRVPVNPIALLKMSDGERTNNNVVCVPLGDPAWNDVEGLDDLPSDLADEISHFFANYSDLEGQRWQVEGWGSREEAVQEIEAARERYREQHG